MVDPEIGATWIDALAAGKEVVLSFNTSLPMDVISPGPLNSPAGGFVNTYTSWGLANDLDIKPVVSAPVEVSCLLILLDMIRISLCRVHRWQHHLLLVL